jgi:hypothetical protein
MAQRKPSPSHSSSANASFIPVMASPVPAPRSSAPRGGLPSSFGLGLPQFGLRRSTSVSVKGQEMSKSQNGQSRSKIPQSPSSPTFAIPQPRAATIAIGRGASSPNSPASPSTTAFVSPQHPSAPNGKPLANSGSNIPKFRSLRNMLPFGPKSTPTPSPSDSNGAALSKSMSKASSSSLSPTPTNLTHRRSSSSIPSHITEQRQQQTSNRSGFLGFTSRSSFSIGGERRIASQAYASSSMSSIHRRRSEDPGLGFRPIPPIPNHPIISIDRPPTEEDHNTSMPGDQGNATGASTPQDRSPILLKRSFSANATLTVAGIAEPQAEPGFAELSSRSTSSLVPLAPSNSPLRTPKSSKADLRGSPSSVSPNGSLRVTEGEFNTWVDHCQLHSCLI